MAYINVLEVNDYYVRNDGDIEFNVTVLNLACVNLINGDYVLNYFI